jgi:hypothetical protein
MLIKLEVAELLPQRSGPFTSPSGVALPVKKPSGNWFVGGHFTTQNSCHFTTQNSKTEIKTNCETNTFPICLFVLSEQLVLSLSVTIFTLGFRLFFILLQING